MVVIRREEIALSNAANDLSPFRNCFVTNIKSWDTHDSLTLTSKRCIEKYERLNKTVVEIITISKQSQFNAKSSKCENGVSSSIRKDD